MLPSARNTVQQLLPTAVQLATCGRAAACSQCCGIAASWNHDDPNFNNDDQSGDWMGELHALYVLQPSAQP
jgi:hypothetical protein